MMTLKKHYFIIPLITVLVAILGGWFTGMGMDWYNTMLIRPEITPPRIAFPIAWNLIFIFTTMSALIVWEKTAGYKFLWFSSKKKTKEGWRIMELFLINAILNVLWSLLFFTFHSMIPAFAEMMLLELTLFILIPITWKVSRLASILLLPYALWIGFATYLVYLILRINT